MALEGLTSGDKLKLSDKGLQVYRMLAHFVARDNSELTLARRKDATRILRLVMSVIQDATIQVCYGNATESRATEKRVSSIILNVYQNTGIEKDDNSRQSLENHAKVGEIKRFSNKKFNSSHEVHRALALAEDYWKTKTRGEYLGRRGRSRLHVKILVGEDNGS